MKNIFKILTLSLAFIFVTSCDLDSDLQSPNGISPDLADINLLINGIQVEFADFFNAAERNVNPLVRMEAMTGGFRYDAANPATNVDVLWTTAYRGIIINADLIIEIGERDNLTTHVAVAKILKAYVYLTLVDIFGDVPQVEAIQGETGNFNPVHTSGADVYAYAMTLLDEARVELAKTGAEAGGALTRDIFYGGNRTRWTALANSLELKAQLNLRGSGSTAPNDARIDVLLLDSNLVDTEAENFTYKYGTAIVPVSQHPVYRQYYGPNFADAGGYIANQYLYELYKGKPDPADPTNPDVWVQDPRWRYYFYRQVGSIAQAQVVDPKSLGCAPTAPPTHYISGGVDMFCVFEPGFYGRDHGDGFGIPPDGLVLTCAGIYPAGGRVDDTFDTPSSTYVGSTRVGQGANGAGIHPIYMSWFTDFMHAEILARRGNNAGAEAQMLEGINASITQVKTFSTSKGQTLSPGREPSTANYIAAVQFQYANAANKLDVIGREYWVSLWGNGVEAYNSYRRTSAPRNLQPTLQINAGNWVRSYVYPAVHANLNGNVTQKDITAVNKVFWDTNAETLN